MRKSIAVILESDTRLTTFLSIIKLAGLYSILNGEETFTVFAPDNNAFEKLTAPVYSRIINEGRPKLMRIMQYHILSGKHRLQDFVHGSKLQTMNGNDVNITIDGDVVRINESKIVRANKIASNGVIHVVDTML